MANRRSIRASVVARNPSEPLSAKKVHDEFDARRYLISTNRWFSEWPNRTIEQLENAGFVRVRLEKIEYHPVWSLHMKWPGGNLTSTEAARMVRTVVEQAGKIPRDAFSCTAGKRGVVEASFLLDV